MVYCPRAGLSAVEVSTAEVPWVVAGRPAGSRACLGGVSVCAARAIARAGLRALWKCYGRACATAERRMPVSTARAGQILAEHCGGSERCRSARGE